MILSVIQYALFRSTHKVCSPLAPLDGIVGPNGQVTVIPHL